MSYGLSLGSSATCASPITPPGHGRAARAGAVRADRRAVAVGAARRRAPALRSCSKAHASCTRLARVGGRLHLLVGEAVAVLDRLHAAAPSTLHSRGDRRRHELRARPRSGALGAGRAGVRWRESRRSSAWCAGSTTATAGGQRGRRRSPRRRLRAAPSPRGCARCVAVPCGRAPARPGGFAARSPPVRRRRPWPSGSTPSSRRRQRGGRHAALEVLRDFLDGAAGNAAAASPRRWKAPTACCTAVRLPGLGLPEPARTRAGHPRASPRCRGRPPPRRPGGLPQPPVLALPLHPEAGERADAGVSQPAPPATTACASRMEPGATSTRWWRATGWPLVDACVAMLRATGY